MPRYQRFIFATIGVLFALAVAATLAINLHLQSPSMQDNLRQGALNTIGMPLTIRSASFTPWDGIRLRGIVIPDMENEGINFLEASEFQIFFRLIPIFRREFIASKVVLKEAILTWRQNENGQWNVPREPSYASTHPSTTPDITPPSSSTPQRSNIPRQPFDIRIENLSLLRSRILFENRDGWPLFDADGIFSNASITSDGNATGHTKIPEAVVAGLVVASDLSSNFVLKNGTLDFPDIRGDISGGTLSGNGSIAISAEGSPYKWFLQLDNFQLNRLRLPEKSAALQLNGSLHADFEIYGRNAPQRQVHGSGRLEVKDGDIIPPPFIQELGRFFNIPELRRMDLENAFADLRLENDIIHVAPLWLRADKLAIELRGTVTRGGNLDINGILFLNSEIASRITSQTHTELLLSDNPDLPDYRTLTFKISGTLQNPESDLARRLFGNTGGRIGNFLFNLLRSR